ncbi:uncharacterized protein A1O9_06597 [Exophiala aquamarina CBS 119918]|uniref:Potassium channel domain-containing protein n=1 Tax=Exophiala aquamarina CBS 119918 TaxID=1182545 RepID=A0A072PFN5_9EURO|nr:uncharacterized protein A1O9_06597 [Exophiala aquamarina CBS 119918]KEF58671.1 hypothetical protein A1O9_06597 [Exophiala aquamarina CBS 119918]
MNDPGLDGPITDASDQVKENVDEQRAEDPSDDIGEEEEEEEERSFVLPARWWYASTGFPLVAGTFGPMANAFSICALVENWRVDIPPGGTEEHGIDIKDPRWLIAVNAISLVCALTANLSLLLNMAGRVSFQVAQPTTIIGFWIASVLLIALIAVAAHDFHAPGVRDQALTQAYYYAIFAAGLYQIISYLMCVTVYGAYRGHYRKEFKLTMAQRTLMLQTIAFLVYQLLGALVFSHIEGWKFLDAVYWADFTSLTIGIGGDYVPTTHLGRGLLFPFAIGGITILGLVVGSIRSLVLDRGKKKMAARLTEKTRAKLVRDVQSAISKKGHLQPRGVMGLEKDHVNALALKPGEGEMSEIDRREAEFLAMRRVQARADTTRKYYSLLVSTFAFAFLWTIGALVFYKAEKNQQWTYFQSLYFAYTSLLTIGYGDLQPISNSGKPFFVFWSLLAVPTLTILISDMGETVVKAIKEATIWLGEITVLPNQQEGMKDRLRYGMYKMTLAKIDGWSTKTNDVGAGKDTSNGRSSFQELHPGLARAFRVRQKNSSNHEHMATEDRLAAEFEESEKVDESIARGRGNRSEEEAHHYRHSLISQIRRVYTDSASATAKKYSYAEWAYFLKLLGEDESDSSLHRKPRSSSRATVVDTPSDEQDGGQDHRSPRQKDFETGGQEIAHSQSSSKIDDEEISRWSWIGSRSPLMGDKIEAEWLLEKLLQRLEESLHDLKKAKEDDVQREMPEVHYDSPSTAGQRNSNSLSRTRFRPNGNQSMGTADSNG